MGRPPNPRRAPVSHKRMGGVARPHALRLDLAGGGQRIFAAVEHYQSAVFTRHAICRAPGKPCNPPRTWHMATPILGTPHPRRNRHGQSCAILLDEPGQTRIRHHPRGMAIFVMAQRPRHGPVGCAFIAHQSGWLRGGGSLGHASVRNECAPYRNTPARDEFAR